MTRLPIWHTDKPTRTWGRIEPMTREDARFWQLRREREKERADG